MAIEKKCENCRNDETNSCDYCTNFNHFEAKEELIRQDERNKIIKLIKKNKEQFDASINSQLYKNEEEKQNYKHSIDDYLYLLIEKIREEQ